MMIKIFKQQSIKSGVILPGFHLALGYTIFYLSLIVLIPLSMLFIKTSTLGLREIGQVVTSPRTLLIRFLELLLTVS